MTDFKLSVYVRNKYYTPSNYYRVVQYMERIEGDIEINEGLTDKNYLKYLQSKKNRNFVVRNFMNVFYYMMILTRLLYFLCKDIISAPKYTIVSKSFCPKYTPYFIIFLLWVLSKRTKIIWDFDDNIFISGEISNKQAIFLQKNAWKIIVTNDFLSEKIDVSYRDKILLLPTSDIDNYIYDLEETNKYRLELLSEKIVLVWLGTSGNLPMLESVVSIIDQYSINHPKEIELKVICDSRLNLKTQKLKISNVNWKRKEVVEHLKKSHIGLMPLVNNEITKGKGGFKLIQYLSSGLPVVGSAVGYNKEVINEEVGALVLDSEWGEVINQITLTNETWLEMSKNAQKRWNSKFSAKRNLETWISILK